MVDTTKLELAKAQILDRIVEITASPKPSYSIDGQSFSWNEYLKTLLEQVKALDEIIAGMQGPTFEITQGFT